MDDDEKGRPQLAAADRSKKDRAAGFLPRTSVGHGGVVLVAVVVLGGWRICMAYYSIRESTDDSQIDGHIDPIGARVSGTVLNGPA